MSYGWKQLAHTFTFSKAANPKVSFDKISASEYVACYYDSNWLVGLVRNVNCDKKDVDIIFLHPPGPSNSFTWPMRKDICWAPYMNVICKIRPLTTTAWKKSKYGVISGPYFPVFGLNTERYSISPCIQSEYRKIWTRNNSVFGHFLCCEH